MPDERSRQDHDAIVTILEKVTAIERHLSVLNGRTARNEDKSAQQDVDIMGLRKDTERAQSRTNFWGGIVSFILAVIAIIQVMGKFLN